MFIETNLWFKYAWSGIWISQESARNTIKNCAILSFKGMLIGARGSVVEGVGYKPEGHGMVSVLI
jgi:hypothetical protein